jgi:hypothetical protein
MNRRKLKKSAATGGLYDYSGVFEREETIAFLLDYAARSRHETDIYWDKMRRYYDGKHDITIENEAFAKKNMLPWTPAESTDGYIHVETQISARVPDFEFVPRDKSDYGKAKQRERIVKYVCDNNGLDYKNSGNERNLNINGSAVWKVCWDSGLEMGADKGDVAVLCPDSREIFTDPTSVDVDGCEYIGYVYKMHRMKAQRIFAKDFERTNTTILDYIDSDIPTGAYVSDAYNTQDDTVTITEWWFRQPTDGRAETENGCVYKWKAGDIALCILIGGKEIRYIPKYWKNTGFKCYPFVIYSKIPNKKSIWGKSELEAIIPLINAKDRELAFAQLNSAYSSNDIILMEENALSDGEALDGAPGSIWKMRPGMMGKIARLGNLSSAQTSLYGNSAYWQSLIENTTGNFEVNQGKEPANVTTATGIALLNERAESRKNLKNIDKNEGFKRLYSLIDKTCLEYYSDGRIARLGLSDENGKVYTFGGYIGRTRQERYIPAVDVTVHTGSAIANSKAFTVSALTTLIGMKVNEDNYKLVKAYVETIGIPERGEICSYLEEKFGKGKEQEITGEEIMTILEKAMEESENE